MGAGKTVKVTVELPEEVVQAAKIRANGDLSGYVLDGVLRRLAHDEWEDERRSHAQQALSEEQEMQLEEVRRWLASLSSTPEA